MDFKKLFFVINEVPKRENVQKQKQFLPLFYVC